MKPDQKTSIARNLDYIKRNILIKLAAIITLMNYYYNNKFHNSLKVSVVTFWFRIEVRGNLFLDNILLVRHGISQLSTTSDAYQR